MKRMIPIAIGMVCIVAMIIGASNLVPNEKNTVSTTVQAAKSAEKVTLGTVVPGVVDSDIEVGYYFGPESMPIAKVKKILVKPGQKVTVGQPLIEFDDTIPNNSLSIAKKAVETANVKTKEAEELAIIMQPLKIEAQKIAVNKANAELQNAIKLMELANTTTEKAYNDARKVQTVETSLEAYRKASPEYLKAVALKSSAEISLKFENYKQTVLEKENPKLIIEEAKAELARLEAMRDQQQSLVDSCVLKSGVDGTIERVCVAPGSIVSPNSQKPSLIVIPSGTRLVRAEVVPEFAHKVSGSVGKKVVIFDSHNENLKYDGEVISVGDAFLPPRFAPQDIMKLNANRVLECTVRITDPSPKDQPALRVGQSVRVSFP